MRKPFKSGAGENFAIAVGWQRWGKGKMFTAGSYSSRVVRDRVKERSRPVRMNDYLAPYPRFCIRPGEYPGVGF